MAPSQKSELIFQILTASLSSCFRFASAKLRTIFDMTKFLSEKFSNYFLPIGHISTYRSIYQRFKATEFFYLFLSKIGKQLLFRPNDSKFQVYERRAYSRFFQANEHLFRRMLTILHCRYQALR